MEARAESNGAVHFGARLERSGLMICRRLVAHAADQKNCLHMHCNPKLEPTLWVIAANLNFRGWLRRKPRGPRGENRVVAKSKVTAVSCARRARRCTTPNVGVRFSKQVEQRHGAAALRGRRRASLRADAADATLGAVELEIEAAAAPGKDPDSMRLERIAAPTLDMAEDKETLRQLAPPQCCLPARCLREPRRYEDCVREVPCCGLQRIGHGTEARAARHANDGACRSQRCGSEVHRHWSALALNAGPEVRAALTVDA